MSHMKPFETRQRRNLPAVMDSTPSTEVSEAYTRYPAAPQGLSDVLKVSWDSLWRSPIARLLDPVSDLPGVRRLYMQYAFYEMKEAQMMESGGGDTTQLNALMKMSAEIRQLEAQLGLSPRSRLALGLALIAGRKSGSLDDAVDAADDDA